MHPKTPYTSSLPGATSFVPILTERDTRTKTPAKTQSSKNARLTRDAVVIGVTSRSASAPPSPARKTSVGRLQATFRAGSRLHVGCGAKRLPGWVNADAVEGVGDVVLDLHDPAALPESTFTTIYACHVLEHCWPEDTPAILKRLRNALLPGGTLRLSVPDLRLVLRNCVESNAYGGERSALAVLYGGSFSKETSSPDLHRQTFWLERLERLLREAGLVNVREWGRGQYPEIDAIGDYATRPAAADGKSLISLNLEADRPPDALYVAVPRARDQVAVDVSVILGTVRRPQMLRDCVEAVRRSLEGSDFTYEVVVAYGDEQEPSLDWMRVQSDVVPVCGGMSGAIDAFNRAYDVSRGRVVCQINDDVIVDGDSLARAVRHLDEDTSCAGVVFKFDRGDGRGYRHELLSGLPHPNQVVARRETCEAVVERIGGFWGDAANRTDKTYGGDTAFGAVCKYLGLRLDSVEGVTCRDLLAQDELRETNKIAVRADHGERWRKMYATILETVAPPPTATEWPNLYVPRAGMRPRKSPVEAGRPLRLLHMSLQTSLEPQRAQREALSEIGSTVDVSWWPMTLEREREVIEAARLHRPDILFSQVQSAGVSASFAKALRDAVGADCLMVNWTGDVRTNSAQPVERWMVELARHYDLMLSDTVTYARKLKIDERVTAACGYLSCGVDLDENAFDESAAETRGVVFLGTNYKTLDGGARERFFTQLSKAVPSVEVYGRGWERVQDVQSHSFVNQREAARVMRSAMVTVSTSLYNDLERYTSDRLKRAMSAGAVVAVRRFPDMRGLGLEHGVNCLVWDSAEDLIGLAREWTRPEKASERRAIRVAAAATARSRFSWKSSTEELLAIVRDMVIRSRR